MAEIRFSHSLPQWESRIKIDTTFLDESYRRNPRYGTWHRGIDANLVTGGNTDMGYPILARFPGIVRQIQSAPGWGICLVIDADQWVVEFFKETLGLDIDYLGQQVAHMSQYCVMPQQRVNAGQVIGSIGDASNGLREVKYSTRYFAHLHEEIRISEQAAIVKQGASDADKTEVSRTCLDPMVLIKSGYFSDKPNILPSDKLYAIIDQLYINDEVALAAPFMPILLNRVPEDKISLYDKLFIKTVHSLPTGQDSGDKILAKLKSFVESLGG